MSQSFLDQLKTMTTVVADTGDFQSMQKFRPRDSTTNPSLILAASKMPEYQAIVDGAIASSKRDAGAGATTKDVVARTMDRVAVDFGLRILEIVPGRVSTEVDARLSYDTAATLEKARHIVGLYNKAGIGNERVLVKMASTWEGIRAAEILEKEGIHCNLTLLFGFHQAVACAEAGVTLISPFVGRILDWYVKSTGRASYPAAEDPGVQSVTTIYNYYKKHGYKTEVMGASFRNVGEITELAGCDLLTIAPKLLGELDGLTGALPRKLDPANAAAQGQAKIDMTEAIFRKMHEEDRMANDKLAEGIEGFSKAMAELETVLTQRAEALGFSEEQSGQCRGAAGSERGAAPVPRRGLCPLHPQRGLCPLHPQRGAAPAPRPREKGLAAPSLLAISHPGFVTMRDGVSGHTLHGGPLFTSVSNCVRARRCTRVHQ
jgi:transaldolase